MGSVADTDPHHLGALDGVRVLPDLQRDGFLRNGNEGTVERLHAPAHDLDLLSRVESFEIVPVTL